MAATQKSFTETILSLAVSVALTQKTQNKKPAIAGFLFIAIKR
jgi:hypothetical protein